MAEKNWDKELAKVDKQLASLSDEQLLGTPASAPMTAPRDAGRAPTKASQPSVAAATPTGTTSLGVYARLAVALAAGAAMVFWPYPSQCGVGLAGYLAAVGVVIAGGVWSAVWTWRHRAPRAHTLSLLLLSW